METTPSNPAGGTLASFWSTVAQALGAFPRAHLGLLLPLVVILFILAAPFALFGLLLSALGGRDRAITKAGAGDAEEMASFVYPLF